MESKIKKMRRYTKHHEKSTIISRQPDGKNPNSRIVIDAHHNTEQSSSVVNLESLPRKITIKDLENNIIQGDSSSVIARLPSDSVACAITSPPYWNLVDYGVPGQIGTESYEKYRASLLEVWIGIERVLRPNGKFCLNVPIMPLRKSVSKKHFKKTHTRMLLDLPGDLKHDILEFTGLHYYSLYIWEKQTTEKMFGSYPYPPNLLERNYCEFILVFVKSGKPPKFPNAAKERAKLTSDEWMELTKQIWWMYPANVKRDSGHPAPFPETLANRLIHMYTFPKSNDYPGDLVLDPFVGCGTTCVVAKREGRRFIGIDLSQNFCNVAAERISKVFFGPSVMKAVRPSDIKMVDI